MTSITTNATTTTPSGLDILATLIAAIPEHFSKAQKYQQLSRLSDTELRARGLTRETLAAQVF